MILALAFIGTSNAKVLLRANKSEPKTWSALDKVDAFMQTLKKAGFDLQEGEFKFGDLIQECCAKHVSVDLLLSGRIMRSFACICNGDAWKSGIEGTMRTDLERRNGWMKR